MTYIRLCGLLVLLLCSCSSEIDSFYPSNDPLDIKSFERALKEAGVKYSIDSKGFYLTSENDRQKMNKIIKAREKDIYYIGIPAYKPCAAKLMRSYLKNNNILFVEELSDGTPQFRVYREDDIKNHLFEQYVSFDRGCECNSKSNVRKL